MAAYISTNPYHQRADTSKLLTSLDKSKRKVFEMIEHMTKLKN